MVSGVVNKNRGLPAVTSTRNQQAPIESSSLFAYFQVCMMDGWIDGEIEQMWILQCR